MLKDIVIPISPNFYVTMAKKKKIVPVENFSHLLLPFVRFLGLEYDPSFETISNQ